MRRFPAFLLLATLACSDGGGGKSGDDDGSEEPGDADAAGEPPDVDAAVQPDARPRPPANCEVTSGTNVVVRLIDEILNGGALLVTSPPFDPRLFVVNHDGEIRIIEDGIVLPTPFLDVSALVAAADEQGLLGLAFHPGYEENRTFFIYYASASANVLARYTTRADDPYLADPESGEVLLSIPDRFTNHNGGMIEFGPDGFLYIGTGDGGGRGDPDDNAENRWSPLGKILRIDVDQTSPGRLYGIPADNPFALGGGAPEVYMMGLRNPWRWSFDENGDMYIGDVGFDQWEELNIVPAGTGAGLNFGWDHVEGMGHCIDPATGCDATGTTMPVFEWNHVADGFCAIVGGAVYRGSCYPDLVGTYFFSDFCDDRIWSLRAENGVITQAPAPLPGTALNGYVSIHPSATGELFVTSNDGRVLRLEVGEPGSPP